MVAVGALPELEPEALPELELEPEPVAWAPEVAVTKPELDAVALAEALVVELEPLETSIEYN